MADATRTDDLFARALGPRRDCGEWTTYAQLDGLICPWCGCDCTGVHHTWKTSADDLHENAITACPDCEREFMCPDEHGDLVCVGLMSPADMKYRAMRAAEKEAEDNAVA